ncbi:MAG: hypothetical protein WCK76_13290, partial [Elusimicrobiota bacterium]
MKRIIIALCLLFPAAAGAAEYTGKLRGEGSSITGIPQLVSSQTFSGTNIFTATAAFTAVNGSAPSVTIANGLVVGAGNVGIGTASPGSALDVKGTLRLSGSNSGYVGFAPAADAGSVTYTLPATVGTSGYALTTNGAGGLTWAAPTPGAHTHAAADLTSGVLPLARLSGITNNEIDAAAGIADTKLGPISSPGKVSNSATTAAAGNTANAIVARDASGSFSAGAITASTFIGALNGNAATATTATTAASATTAGTATNVAGGSAGTIHYQSGTGTTAMLAAGTAGYMLTGNGAAAPGWTQATNTNAANALVQRDA